MSTKGLMADKRVESVTLNEAGKAATLTLLDPWRYNGEKGPFTLTSVDHGHKIVKGATGGVVTRAPRSAAPTAPKPSPTPTGEPTEAMKLDPGSETPSTAAPALPGAPCGAEELFVYRIVRQSDEMNHEVVGWLKTTRRWTKANLESHSLQQLCQFFKGGREALHKYQDASFLWTKAMEKKARADQTLGSPWPSENISHGAEE